MSSFNNSSDINDIITGISGTTLDEGIKSTNCVSFAGRQLKLNTAEDGQEIADAINACNEMVTLDLEGNTMGIEAARTIGKALEKQSHFKNALFKDLFTGRLKTEIPDALMFLTSGIELSGAKLTILDLSDNAFGPIGVKALVPFLQSSACSELQVLRLNNNGLGIQGGKQLATAISGLTKLRVFICGRNRLENEAGAAIGNSLAKITTLETLEMPQNGIREQAIAAIAKAVEVNRGLRVLNLNDNIVKPNGAQLIANALKGAQNVEVINLGDCLLKSAGAIHVLLVFLENVNSLKRLRELILNGNEIGGSEVVSLIQEMFEHDDRYDLKLDLSCNNFGEDRVEQLLELLENKITDLNIEDDEGSEDEEEEDENGEAEDEEAEDEEEDGEDEDEVEADKRKTGDSIKEKEHEKDVNKPTNDDVDQLSNLISNDENIDDLCEKFIQISIDGFDRDSAKVRDDALRKSDLLLQAALSKDPDEFKTANTLLSHLGLIKSEEGYHKKERDIRGPLVALTHSLGQLSPTQKQILQLFMSKPNKAAEQTGKIKHNLMQALFR